MNKIKLFVISALFAAIASVSSAQVSIGISGTGISMDATGSETQSTETRTETLEAIYGSVFVEFDTGMGFSLGIDVLPYTIDGENVTNVRGSGNTGTAVAVDSGTNRVSVDIENHLTLYGLKNLNDDVYVKFGISEADVLTDEDMGATSTKYPDATMNGMHLSLGTAFDTGAGVTVRAEAGYSEYDDVSVTGTGGDGTANTVSAKDLSGPTVKISLVKAF